ncbi:flavodoxin family protein [Bacillus sp. WMMC1349]|uniref:flavodoxin family protein n=1 Tax=Bacillus sp. WMMC1349 TaxID=2736254 RepID=UPI00155701B0|nr:flavodoxin family protein [Bacillus sp. WMMC1349]NPC93160.1 flavodoxin family protein [Bacillus sp. WMMC1349]
MKNIFVYVGSRNKSSRIVSYTNNILNVTKHKLKGEVNIDLLTPLDFYLHPSTGCKNCFNKGSCPNDILENDDGALIKEKIEKADLIILASPVYSHNVSSDMKLLIDRLSYWAHLFKLIGKPSIVIASAESNGADFVTDYLGKVLSFMGSKVELKTSFVNSEDNLRENKLDEIVTHILKICSSDYKLTPSVNQEVTFQTLKLLLQNYPESHFEYKYWKENGFFECDSFENLLKLCTDALKC